jgi:DHA1 family inner membrane transport protein
MLSFATITIAVSGYLVVFTYLVPLLTDVSGVPLELVPLVLVALGAGAFIGNIVGGRIGDWKPLVAVVIALAGGGCIYLLMPHVAGSAWLMTATLFAWAVISWMFVAPVQARILKFASDAPNFVATLISTAFNLGIALGAWLGGAALTQGLAYTQLPLISVGAVACALAIILLSFALERRGRPLAATAAASSE